MMDIVRFCAKVVRGLKDRLQSIVSDLCAQSRWTATLYFLLFSTEMQRECLAVLQGKQSYRKALRSKDGNLYLLRRNVHRLEKGLIMVPFRETFATDYIAETVRTLTKLEKQEDNTAELQWFVSVLSEYFQKASGHRTIDKARKLFEEYQETSTVAPTEKTPFTKSTDASKISYEDFLLLSKQRRSVRWFQDKPVPRELIDKAIEIAIQSPSACNRLPYQFFVYDEPELVQKIGRIPGGTAGFSQNFPAIVVVVGSLGAYFHERDRHVPYIDGSLAAMSFVYALETLGLSSCMINWPDVARCEKEMQAALGLTADQRVTMLIALGWADSTKKVPYSQKKPLNVIRNYNQTGP